MLPLVLVLALSASVAPAPQTLGDKLAELAAVADPYPPVRPKTRVHAFLVDRDADVATITAALAPLATTDARCRLAGDLDTSFTHAKVALASVEAPVAIDAKDLTSALKKGSKRVDRLACTAFRASSTAFATGVNSKRDELLTSAGDARWALVWAGSYQLYTAPGKVKTKALATKLGKIIATDPAPALAVDTFTWMLSSAVEAEAAKKLEKALLGIPGVTAAAIGASKNELAISVALEGLDAIGPPLEATPAQVQQAVGQAVGIGMTITKASFDTTPIFDVLDREKITPRAK